MNNAELLVKKPDTAMALNSISPEDVGRIAQVRQRQYQVEEVRKSQGTSSTIVRLSGIDADNLGRSLEVIWEQELDAQLATENWGLLGGRGFDPPDRFSAYYHTLRWNRVTAARTDLFQAPFRAGISIEHYQLEPLRMALSMPRVNLFVADGVGLGKTIEAGLVARELLLRRKISEIVVCCPPSMLYQWQEEMETRFGLLFQIIDRAYVHRIRKERGYNVNPWDTHNRFIISHNLVKDEEYAADLRSWLGRDLVRPRSLLILDEAHHAAPASGGTYAITSQFTRRVMEFAPKFEHKLFLSATPHNGHPNSFRTLMAILDPQRFCQGVPVRARERDQVLIYRLKEDLRQLGIAFPQREVEPVRIPAPVKGTPELELASKLEDYCNLREERLRDQALKVRNASAFLKSGLQQRLLSSVEAFWRTLNKHNQTIQEQLHQHGRQLAPDAIKLDEQELSAIGSGVDADEEADEVIETTDPSSSSTTESTPPVTGEDPRAAEAERQTEKATLATLGDPNHPNFAREMKLLDEMMTTADRARHSPDEKLKKLFEYVERQMLEPTPRGSATGRGWTAHRILIFTEYDDTLTYVRRHLEAFIQSTLRSSERLAIYKGSTSLEERQEIKEAFNSDPTAHPVRILLATDAAREGINLQKYCFNLFHYDVPWNPARLEQRNGRIDRKLQPALTVYCRYFLYENREEDAILRKIVEKTENIYRELGGFGTVLDKNLIQMLRRRGIDRKRVAETCGMLDLKDPEEEQRSALALVELSSDDELPDEPGPSTIEFDRDRIDQKRRDKLDKSVQKLRHVFEASSRWLHFQESQFRAALDCALRLMEIEGGLTPEPVERPKARRYYFPTASLEKNPTWRETINSLRAPRRRREDLGAWYARCPVRPIVFEDPGVLQLGQPLPGANGEAAAEPVHMHLEHRISRRLLSRFQSQGFVYDDLSRACLTQTEGSLPLVYLLGRLCLYGHQAARLHEDLIAVCAEWTPPDTRRGPLKPIDKKKLSEEEAMRRLDEALLEADMSRITETRRQVLLSAADRDVRELHEHLKKQANTLESKVREDLTKACAKEAENTRKLLEDLGKRIDERLDRLQHEDATKHERARQRAAKAGPTLFDLDEPPEPIWDERARRERAAEKRAMEQRKAAIPREIQEEPDRIRQRYAVQTVRLEPVGIVYLWPEKG